MFGQHCIFLYNIFKGDAHRHPSYSPQHSEQFYHFVPIDLSLVRRARRLRVPRNATQANSLRTASVSRHVRLRLCSLVWEDAGG